MISYVKHEDFVGFAAIVAYSLKTPLFPCQIWTTPKDIAPRENQHIVKKNIREFHVESPYPTHTPAAYYTDATFLGDITSMILAKCCQLSDFFPAE